MTEPVRPLPPAMTVEEFLHWEDGTDTRYELLDGVVTAMAPPSPAHSRIAGNIAVAVGGKLRPPCRIHAEQGLPAVERPQSYYQADLAVVCGDITLCEPSPAPVFIIEILSPSTTAHDRGRKAADYRMIPECGCILLVRSDRRHVERWLRDGDRWIVTDHIGEVGEVAIPPLELSINLAEIYAGVSL